jgi:hypothetical protein
MIFNLACKNYAWVDVAGVTTGLANITSVFIVAGSDNHTGLSSPSKLLSRRPLNDSQAKSIIMGKRTDLFCQRNNNEDKKLYDVDHRRSSNGSGKSRRCWNESTCTIEGGVHLNDQVGATF